MLKTLFSPAKVALFGGLIIFSALLWLNGHIGYTAKSILLFSGQNNTEDETLAATVAAFAETNTFAERTLNSGRLQDGPMGQLLPEEQQALINAVTATGGKSGGVVTVKSSSLDADTAQSVSIESMETLLRMSRFYLGSEQKFTITVIDKAVIKKGIVYPFSYGLQVIVTALVLFMALIFLHPGFLWVYAQLRKVTPLKKKIRQEERDQRFVPQKLDPAFFYPEASLTEEDLGAEEALYDQEYGHSAEPSSKTPLQSVSVSMDELPFSFETPVEETTSESHTTSPVEAAEVPTEKPEPSVLEYKRRLNELLAQK